jgi:glycosyltransferase involved in cell wall biosynthesis
LTKEPLVSVIIPVYNSKRWIERTIASAIAQTYRHIEIIVVDDGSTDDTADMIEAVALRDSRVRLFRQPHAGVSATRNFGIRQARGELIAPLDSDDLWHPEKLARQVAAMQAAPPKVGLVYSWAVEIDENDFITLPIKKGPTAEGNVLMELIAKAGLIDSGSNPLIRRLHLEAVGGYDSSLYEAKAHCAEDWKLCLALAEVCEFAVVPEYLVGYRRSSSSKSRNENMERALVLISNWILARWPDTPAEVKRKNLYNRSMCLTHLALTRNQFVKAMRYKMMGYKVRPATLFEPATFIFVARVIARMVGMPRSNWPIRARSIAFENLQTTSQLRTNPQLERKFIKTTRERTELASPQG